MTVHLDASWQIVIERYPELGEPMDISTWPTGFKGMFGDRNFILEDKEGNILAWANSLWIYMDLEKGRPTKPSKEDIEKIYKEIVKSNDSDKVMFITGIYPTGKKVYYAVDLSE
mgnify:CR=1 FL=1